MNRRPVKATDTGGDSGEVHSLELLDIGLRETRGVGGMCPFRERVNVARA